jgi:hypothetical protein
MFILGRTLFLAVLLTVLIPQVVKARTLDDEDYARVELPWVKLNVDLRKLVTFAAVEPEQMFTWLRNEEKIAVSVLDSRPKADQLQTPLEANVEFEKGLIDPEYLTKHENDPKGQALIRTSSIENSAKRQLDYAKWYPTLDLAQRAHGGGIYLPRERGVIVVNPKTFAFSHRMLTPNAQSPQVKYDMFWLPDTFHKKVGDTYRLAPDYSWKTVGDWVLLYSQYLMHQYRTENAGEPNALMLDDVEKIRQEVNADWKKVIPPQITQRHDQSPPIDLSIRADMTPEITEVYKTVIKWVKYHLLTGSLSYGEEMASVQLLWSLRDRLGRPEKTLATDKEGLKRLIAHWAHNQNLYLQYIWRPTTRWELVKRLAKAPNQTLPESLRDGHREMIELLNEAMQTLKSGDEWVKSANELLSK